MRKAVIHIAIILQLWVLPGYGSAAQTAIHFPAEKLAVHLTQTCLFPGEVLGFKMYCTNPLFPELELSRVAFIELVSEQNASILRKKILLEQGGGEGCFILPEDLDTGFYTVLAYTNWLKNFGETFFHRQRIMVINPDQQAPISDTCIGAVDFPPVQETRDISPDRILIFQDKTQYATREKVTLKVRLTEDIGQQAGALLSVSVCRAEPELKQTQPEVSTENMENQVREIEYLPDYTGIRLTGKMEDAYGALQGARIIISEPGRETAINSTLSDTKGNFHFLLEPQTGMKDIVFTLPKDDAIVKLEDPFWNGFRNLPVSQEVCLSTSTARYLQERFYHYQIQQKFNQQIFLPVKPADADLKNYERFYTHHSRSISLDDYVLLDSLSEYFYELLPAVRFIQNREKYEIKIMDRTNQVYYKEKPGVFLDGVLYTDFNEMARIPVKQIDNITVLPEVYYYRDFVFGGIVDLHTRKSDFTEVQLLGNMTRFLYPIASESEMSFTGPVHSSDSLTRTPDFRYLLHWDPDVQLKPGGESEIQFYTGDVSGDFKIKITGLTSQGRLIRSETIITVYEEPSNKR